MTDQPDNQRRKPLVSVEWQREVDVSTGKAETRVFVKMYFEARDSGLLAALPDELWKTLCCLATFMDQNGNCYPSQALLAKYLGISRQHANKRIQRLLAFRFQGSPVISVRKERSLTKKGGRWANNVYQLHPLSGFAIFDNDKPMSPWGDIGHLPVSAEGDTGKGDTNQNHNSITRPHGVVDPSKGSDRESAAALVGYFHEKAAHGAVKPTGRELSQAKALLEQHGAERCRWVVEFALQQAETTNFRMRHLGAVLSYVSDALNAFQAHQEAERKRAAEAERGRREDKAREEERRAWQNLSIEERIQRRLERSILAFTNIHKREPTEWEVERLQLELEQEYAGQEAASGEAANLETGTG